ncbi:hypothetical protein J7E62_28725 [Variovorax paradoxus]|nr:hypothetical protein [Variovorax paradoxus]
MSTDFSRFMIWYARDQCKTFDRSLRRLLLEEVHSSLCGGNFMAGSAHQARREEASNRYIGFGFQRDASR